MATWFFFGNEWRLAWRRHRLLLLSLVFLLLALASPLAARLTPELLKSTLGGNLGITLPKPTSVDSWTQFYKNVTQLGQYLLAILFSGSIAQEVRSGTLVNLVTKGLPRYAVVLAKYLMAVVLWCGSLFLSFLVCWGYTRYYFPDDLTPRVWAGLLPVLVFGLFFMALVLLGSAASTSSFAGFLVAAAGVLVMTLLNMLKAARRFNPVTLVTDNLAWTTGAKDWTSAWPAVAVTIALAALCVILAIQLLDRRRL